MKIPNLLSEVETSISRNDILSFRNHLPTKFHCFFFIYFLKLLYTTTTYFTYDLASTVRQNYHKSRQIFNSLAIIKRGRNTFKLRFLLSRDESEVSSSHVALWCFTFYFLLASECWQSIKLLLTTTFPSPSSSTHVVLSYSSRCVVSRTFFSAQDASTMFFARTQS